MLRALVDGEKVFAMKGVVGVCPGCHQPVIPKCGNQVVHHWAHKVGDDCDSWYEPTGPWHLSWQSLLLPDNIEVQFGRHRADIVGNEGVVVELQHSPIQAEMIAAREIFYGNMVWLFDATHRFRKVRSGHRVFFAFGRTKHIETCKRPVFLDFGDVVVEVEKFTDRFPRCSGFGIPRDRKWFLDTFLRSYAKPNPTIQVERSPPKETAGPWDKECPYFAMPAPTKWIDPVTSQERIIPKGEPCLRLNYEWVDRSGSRPLSDDIIDQFPDIANGWSKEDIHEMEGLLTGQAMIFNGLLRVMPAFPEKMVGKMRWAVAWSLWNKAVGHMKAGRIPVLRNQTKERIMGLCSEFERSRDKRNEWKPRVVKQSSPAVQAGGDVDIPI